MSDASIVSYPLVSVICLCYNQGAYVQQALQSVISQTYPSVELIIADDASTDGSRAIIERFAQDHPHTQLILNDDNQGNCQTFNKALALAKGKYIIDLAADDVLLNQRIEKQVAVFEEQGETCALVYSNATLINEKGIELQKYFATDHYGKAIRQVPTGDVYERLLWDDFICPPTTMFRKAVLDQLGGYDEALSYEDFDCWIRMARNYAFAYLDEVTMLRRVVKNSWGQKPKIHLASSLIICQKAFRLNCNQTENHALARRIRYFIRQCWFLHQFELANDFGALLRQVSSIDFVTKMVLTACQFRFPIQPVHGLYRQITQKLE